MCIRDRFYSCLKNHQQDDPRHTFNAIGRAGAATNSLQMMHQNGYCFQLDQTKSLFIFKLYYHWIRIMHTSIVYHINHYYVITIATLEMTLAKSENNRFSFDACFDDDPI